MSDLVERLRTNTCRYAHESEDQAARRRLKVDLEAADEIERLTNQLVCMRSALAPFAKLADDMERINVPPVGDDYKLGHSSITTRNLRAARTAFTDDQSEKSK